MKVITLAIFSYCALASALPSSTNANTAPGALGSPTEGTLVKNDLSPIPRPDGRLEICDGPKVADITAAYADCRGAADLMTAGLDTSSAYKALEYRYALSLPPNANVPPRQSLPANYGHKRCRITVNFQPGVKTTTATATAGGLRDTALKVATSCVSTNNQPRGGSPFLIGRGPGPNGGESQLEVKVEIFKKTLDSLDGEYKNILEKAVRGQLPGSGRGFPGAVVNKARDDLYNNAKY